MARRRVEFPRRYDAYPALPYARYSSNEVVVLDLQGLEQGQLDRKQHIESPLSLSAMLSASEDSFAALSADGTALCVSPVRGTYVSRVSLGIWVVV